VSILSSPIFIITSLDDFSFSVFYTFTSFFFVSFFNLYSLKIIFLFLPYSPTFNILIYLFPFLLISQTYLKTTVLHSSFLSYSYSSYSSLQYAQNSLLTSQSFFFSSNCPLISVWIHHSHILLSETSERILCFS